MPLFYKLDGLGKDTARVAGRLEALRQAMQTHPDGPQRSVPGKNVTDTLLLATWNLKEFEGGKNDWFALTPTLTTASAATSSCAFSAPAHLLSRNPQKPRSRWIR